MEALIKKQQERQTEEALARVERETANIKVDDTNQQAKPPLNNASTIDNAADLGLG
jgi:hypothetical protein